MARNLLSRIITLSMTMLKAPSVRPREVATLLIATLIASGAAFFNGYPTVFPDTGAYLGLYNYGDRSIFYGLFLAPLRLTHTLWPKQSFYKSLLVVAHLLRLALREVFAITSQMEFLAVIALMCMLTSLPWYTAYLMPDIFTPVLVLGLFMLAFCFERLERWERCFVVALTFVALVVHYSHLPIAIGLLAAGIFVRLIQSRYAGEVTLHLPLPAIVIATGLVAVVTSNYLMFGLATLSPGGYAFEFSRLEQNGPAVAYLRENCPSRNYAVCAWLDRMPMSSSDFVWSEDGPIGKLGFIGERKRRHGDRRADYRKISAVGAPRRACGHLPATRPQPNRRWSRASRADAHSPTVQLRRFLSGRLRVIYGLTPESRRAGSSIMRVIPEVDSDFLLISLVGFFLVGILFVSRRQWLPLELIGTVGFAILLHAFVTGALADPTNRYGSRIIWLIPLIAIASWRTALGWGTGERRELPLSRDG